MSRRLRQSIIGVAAAALVAAGLTVGVYSTGAAPPPVTGDAEMPKGLGAHLEQLKQSIPGNQGMAADGPGAVADAAFDMRAYPDNTISVQKEEAVRQSWSRALSRRHGSSPGRWQPVGPSSALYPLTEFRNSGNYVPNAYVAGGRTTDMAIAKRCVPGSCRAWITPSGGGVWRTEDAMRVPVKWTYLGGPLGINAAGTITIDPRNSNTIWVGTGEANACGSGCIAGVGAYKSTNGGRTWTGPLGKSTLSGKGIGEIIVDPRNSNVVYAATTTALRGMSSSCCAGVTRPVPGAAKWGLYKSVDGGRTWAFLHNGTADPAQCTGSTAEFNNQAACSPRGVRHLELDPRNPDIVYAGSFARGIWRSPDRGASWTQIKPSLAESNFRTRPAFDVVALPNGKSRMYVHEGNNGTPYSRLFRSDDVASGTPAFTDLTSNNPADPGYGTYNTCGGQCWYDIFVVAPDGHPDLVYTGGAYAYGEQFSNKRAVVLSRDAGVTSHDVTMDGTDATHPNALHPDQHSLVVHPRNPEIFFETNDGGVMRSNGRFVDRSSWCDDRGLTNAAQLARCKQLLSRIPERMIGMNDGLSTLQFISLSVSPHNSRLLQGGTQDNGTWENKGRTDRWVNTMIGDGGQSGWDVQRKEFRFHTFFDVSPEVNFDNGDIADWIWTADPIYGIPGNEFYAPVITDPVVSGTMFAGTARTVHRTKTFGLGTRTLAEANRVCNTWTGTFEAVCGDWEETGPDRLTSTAFGADRAGGAVVAVERSRADKQTAWAATSTGRLFVSRNIDAEPASAVRWTRVDDDSASTPNRYVSSIHVVGTRAFVSYSGFSSSTPTTPAHVLEASFDETAGTASFRDLSYDLADLPISDLVRDDRRGDLYAATDFGVLRLVRGARTWVLASTGMPNVSVAGLTIVGKDRVLYAATHGLSAWRMRLP